MPQKSLLQQIEKQMIVEGIVTFEDLDKEPFDEIGGFERINKRFENHLPDIQQKINTNMYNGNQTA